MDVSKLKLFGMMKEKMRFIGERQKLIAQNIANVNTPGYISKDIKMDFKAMVEQGGGAASSGKVPMAVTHPGHMQASMGGAGHYKTINIKNNETTPTGNNVVLEDELLKMQENNQSYAMTSELYRKMSTMLKAAIGAGQ